LGSVERPKSVERRIRTVKKLVIITAWLVETPEAYKGKTNQDVEEEILEKVPAIPYVARIERVTVLDAD